MPFHRGLRNLKFVFPHGDFYSFLMVFLRVVLLRLQVCLALFNGQVWCLLAWHSSVFVHHVFSSYRVTFFRLFAKRRNNSTQKDAARKEEIRPYENRNDCTGKRKMTPYKEDEPDRYVLNCFFSDPE